MNGGPRRGVTRGYVGALILAATIVAVAVLIAAWGGLALGLGIDPVSTQEVPRWAAPGLLILALVLLGGSLWQQSLVLLRGRRSPAWAHIIGVSGGAYLLWSLGGMLAGMSLEETWLSPFGAVIPVIWFVISLLYWAVLMRRVYTDRPTPRWPWDRPESTD